MELIFICPKCEFQFKGEDLKCSFSKCDYEIRHDIPLIETVVDSYNSSLKHYSDNNIIKAFNVLDSNIYIYPFIKKPLELGYYLSLEIGEYDKCSQYLNSLKTSLEISDYNDKVNLLNSHINIYNRILENDSDLIIRNNLSVIHLYLVYLKAIKKNEGKILKKLFKNNLFKKMTEMYLDLNNLLENKDFYIREINEYINGNFAFNELDTCIEKADIELSEKLKASQKLLNKSIAKSKITFEE